MNNASSGGNLNASFSMGGKGGDGGSSSGVNFYADGTFITKGDTSYGVLLQSIGGGGGSGGSVTSNVAAGEGNKTANSSFALGAAVGAGAEGGGGGNSGDVSGSIAGVISTSGAGSIGLFAQSVGGGGGVGGSVTNSASAEGEATFAASATFGMGGKGGDGQTDRQRGIAGFRADSPKCVNNDRDDHRFNALKQCFYQRAVALRRCNPSKNHHKHHSRDNECGAGKQCAAHPMQAPTDISRQLLGLGSRQQHGVVQPA